MRALLALDNGSFLKGKNDDISSIHPKGYQLCGTTENHWLGE